MTTTHRPITRSAARLLAAGIALTALIGCSSNEPKFDTFPADTSAAPLTNEASTALAAESPAAATTSTAPASTTASPVPTTTLEQSVIEGFELTQWRGGECVQSPTTCDLAGYALEGSQRYDNLRSLLDQRIADGVLAHRVPELDYWNVESVRMGVDQRSAKVTYCEVDGYWLHDANGTWEDLSDDVLIDDTLSSWRREAALVLTPDGWRVTEILKLEEWSGENQCGEKR
jgi:hypothetical protein